jgi:PAS domain S-box-containing protein
MITRSYKERVITSWNRGAERLYGWTRQEAIGRVAHELLNSRYPVPLEAIEAELLRTGRWEGEVEQDRKDGTSVHVACRLGLQTDASGKPYAIILINSDVTAARRAAEDLRHSQERFELFVDAVVDYAIFMLDPDGTVISWNQGAERTKGYTAAEIIGRHFSVFYPPEDRDAHKPERALRTAAEEGRYLDEGWRMRKDGTRFWASVVITALRDEAGELRGFGKVTRDITDRRNYEERLRRHADELAHLEHAKTQFLDLAAHELRAPLTLIRGYNSLLEDRAIPPERIPQIAHMLEGKLAQIDLLVEQMLEMARLENDRLELHREVFDLRELAQDQIKRFQPLTERHDIAMAEESTEVMVESDRSRVATVVGNLIDNAIKYSPAGGPIRIVSGTHGDSAFVTVRDRGLGISPEHLPLLFKRFSRLPTEENKTIAGTGLALYLCSEIARRLGGEVGVRSEPGRGSEFTLRLPGPARRGGG